MITSERMAAVDENAAALGVPRRQLMESSGNAVAEAVRERAEPGDRVTIVCGRGNNGGDGFVAARFLTGFEVRVVLLGRAETITTEIARANWDALDRAAYEPTEVGDASEFALEEPDVVVDAMLGTGAYGALREPMATAAREINGSDATVVAVDVPSGVDADTGDVPGEAVDADHVVTFHDRKPGLDAVDATVSVADIGIPETAELFVERGDLLGARTRASSAHKGDHGELLVVGGGPYSGAPSLCGVAALRAGADLVHVACPAPVADAVRAAHQGLIVHELPGDRLRPGHVDGILELAAGCDTTVLGPGLGRADPTLAAAREFLENVTTPVVVDADPLRVVPDIEHEIETVCTPHQGELRAMGGPHEEDWRDRTEAVEAFAAGLDVTLLVTGRHDVISDGERTRVNRSGTPAMTVGGTGDVLAGVVGARLAVDEPLPAAAVAAHVTGRAGERAAAGRAGGLLPTDLHGELPPALWGDDDE